MQNIQKILVPYDFSEKSENALATAIRLAEKYKSTLTVLHVFERALDSEILKYIVFPKDIEAKLKAKIDSELKRLHPAENSMVKIETIVKKGKATVEILLVAEKEKADLIVMGTQGKTGLQHLILGSVAEKVIRKTASPVLIQRGKSQNFKKVLVPIDFSHHAEEALHQAVQYAEDFNAELHLLHVVDLRDLYTFDVLSIPADRMMIEKSLKKETEEKLSCLTPKISIKPHLEVRLGDPFLEIESSIQENSIDLVVLTTHGRGGLKHLMMGSVAEKVVRLSPCSVLTICPHDFLHSNLKVFEGENEMEDYLKNCRG